MTKTILVEGSRLRAALQAFPVTRGEFLEFAEATGRAMPHGVAHPHRACAPMTDVPHVEALEYCRWRGALEGQAYRLPTAGELAELYRLAGDNPGNWPIWAQERQECQDEADMLAPDEYLCEWTAETQSVEHANGVRTLGAIFYPPWAGRSRTQAAVDATKGYAFVSFRLACTVG